MNKWVIVAIVVILVVLAGGGFLLSQQGNQIPSPAPTVEIQATPLESSSPQASAIEESTSTESGTTAGATKTFTVSGSSFKFTPATLAVNKGDKVTITFKNTSGTHDFTLTDFNVHTAQLSAGQSETVTFTASKAGTFEYFCSVGNHRQMGMTGTLTVK